MLHCTFTWQIYWTFLIRLHTTNVRKHNTPSCNTFWRHLVAKYDSVRDFFKRWRCSQLPVTSTNQKSAWVWMAPETNSAKHCPTVFNQLTAICSSVVDGLPWVRLLSELYVLSLSITRRCLPSLFVYFIFLSLGVGRSENVLLTSVCFCGHHVNNSIEARHIVLYAGWVKWTLISVRPVPSEFCF